MKELLRYKFDVVSDDYVNGGKASSQIKKTLLEIGYDPVLIRRVAITSYEAEMNLVIHSKGGQLILIITEESIILQSIDCGPGISNIEQAMEKGYSTASLKAREMGFGAGMGLPNMKKNSDEFYIESSPEGTHIKVLYHTV